MFFDNKASLTCSLEAVADSYRFYRLWYLPVYSLIPCLCHVYVNICHVYVNIYSNLGNKGYNNSLIPSPIQYDTIILRPVKSLEQTTIIWVV